MKKLQIMVWVLSALLLTGAAGLGHLRIRTICRKHLLPMLPRPRQRKMGTNMLRRKRRRGRTKSPALPTQLLDRWLKRIPLLEMKSLRWGKLLRGKMERVRRLRRGLLGVNHPIRQGVVLPSLRGIVHPHLRGVGRMRRKHLRRSRRRKALTWTTGWAMPRTTPWALVCGWMKMQRIAGTRPSDAAVRRRMFWPPISGMI